MGNGNGNELLGMGGNGMEKDIPASTSRGRDAETETTTLHSYAVISCPIVYVTDINVFELRHLKEFALHTLNCDSVSEC